MLADTFIIAMASEGHKRMTEMRDSAHVWIADTKKAVRPKDGRPLQNQSACPWRPRTPEASFFRLIQRI